MMGRMCFDGDAVWMIMCNLNSQPLSGNIRKLPRSGYR
jgi:hypothetical protein